MKILVLCGGESEERAVSLCSGERVAEGLRERGHAAEVLDFCEKAADGAFFSRCRAADAVFLALHGGAGEDGRVQEMLERAGIFHYTGSGPTASLLAMEKTRAKSAVAAVGVPVARGALWRPGEKAPVMPLPMIVKPEMGGSSVGLSLVTRQEELEKITPSAPLLCEEYLCGREFSVGVLGKRALPPVEICPQGGLYDYYHKYTAGACEEICPAPLPAAGRAELQALALVCFTVLGLRDLARIDFRADGAGRPCFLEANTLPGMTATSLLPQAAQAVGIGFGELCEEIARMGAKRRNSASPT